MSGSLDDHVDKKKYLIPLDQKIYDLGYLRSNRKPGVCYKKCIAGVAFLDYRNIGLVPRAIQVEEGPQFRFKVEKPYWKSIRARELQKKLLDENKIKFQLSFYATLERLNELNQGKSDGYCKFCTNDFEDDGLFCSKGCETQYNNQGAVICGACFMPILGLNGKSAPEHHVSYFPEETIPVHQSCHLEIHRSDKYLHLRPPEDDKDKFYQKGKYNSKDNSN